MTTVNYTSRILTVRDSLSPEQQAVEEARGYTVYREGGKVFILKTPTIVPDGFPTFAMPITEATLVDGKLHSFKFTADAWYSDPPARMIDKGIVGEVDLAKCKTESTSKYQDAYNGVIATYVTNGKITN